MARSVRALCLKYVAPQRYSSQAFDAGVLTSVKRRATIKDMKKLPAAFVIASVMVVSACSSAAGSSGSGSSGSAGAPTGAAPSQQAPQHRGGNLTILTQTAIKSLDKTHMQLNDGIWTIQHVEQTLYVASPDATKLEPSLATSYTVSKDQKTWTFHLRKGVKFSNGQPMTSKDVKFSLDLNDKKSSQWQFINSAISSITTPDKYTVQIHTKYPWSPLLADVALFANGIVPYNFGGKTEAQFAQKPIGTGPFMISSWSKGDHITLKKNPYYWRKGQPYLDSVTVHYVDNANSRVTQAQGGAVGVAEAPPFSVLPSLQNSPTVSGKEFKSSQTNFILFNVTKKPFTDARVRRAIALAIDRAPIIKSVYFGKAQPATSFLTPALWGHINAIDTKPNPAEAKKLLKEAGYGHGLSIRMNVDPGDQSQVLTAQIIQSQLKNVGINLSVQKDSNNLSDQISGNFSMALGDATTDIIDPDEMIRFIGDGKGGSFALDTRYNNPQVNKLANQAGKEFSKAARSKIYAKIQKMVGADAPNIPLVYQPFTYVVSKKVHNFFVSPIGSYALATTWVSK